MEKGIAIEKLAEIQAHLAIAGNVVQVCTHLRATVYSSKHAGMFREANGSLYVARGRHFDCIDYNLIRFGHEKKN